MTELPGLKKEKQFISEETDLLAREVKARERILNGDGRIPSKPAEVKKTWSEVVAIITSSSGITRTAAQCKK